MKYVLTAFVLSLLWAGMPAGKVEASPGAGPVSPAKASAKAPAAPASKGTDKETEKILHWFEQMDAIYREGLWVIRKRRAPPGKSLFGKMQRALLSDLKQKLSNKSIFKCDVYSMKRNIRGLGGVPQDAEVLHRCNSKENFIPIGEWSHPDANTLSMSFRGGNLSEVLGMAAGTLSPRIQCQLKSADNGLIERFSCDHLMMDYDLNKNQVLRFTTFEYAKDAKEILLMRAEVLENLEPLRKIEVSVPKEGKITVKETVLQAPQFAAKKVAPAPSPSPSSLVPKPTQKLNPLPSLNPELSHQENPHAPEQGPEKDPLQNPESQQQQQEFGPEVFPAAAPGVIPAQELPNPEGEGLFPPGVQAPQDPSQPDIPRELNTR